MRRGASRDEEESATADSFCIGQSEPPCIRSLEAALHLSTERRDDAEHAGAEHLRDITGTLWEPPIGVVLRPFRAFARLCAAGGILLGLCTIVALVWANSPWADSYTRLWHAEVTVGGGRVIIRESLVHWVNDGLMAVFFFVVGLEIKCEVLIGCRRGVVQSQQHRPPCPFRPHLQAVGSAS